MRRLITIALLGLAGAAVLLALAQRLESPAQAAEKTSGEPPELAYLREVNAWGPPADPQLLFLLMGQFANAGRQLEGAAYFQQLLDRFGPHLDDRQRALYLTALASLRAGGAARVSVFKRIGWVRETVADLDEAKRLTGNRVFITRWMSGIVRAQLPAFFGERDQALDDLRWCEANADKAPHAGWLREVYAFRARLARDAGDAATATAYAERGGPQSDHAPALFTTPFSEDFVAGHTFAPRAVREVVPGSVYLVSGFEFTDYAFVISADRRELIAIDAGSRADAAAAALAALHDKVPNLPPLTTVFITHAHWDHVGGQKAFRSLTPAPRFIGRSNYAEELERDAMADPATLRRFFGRDFSLEDALAYRPDMTIDRPTTLTIGGTRFDLVPARGGETTDAMLIHLPEQGVLFAGDILMPYLGAPFAEEGSLEGLVDAIDQVHALAPRFLLQGHEPLTRVFNSTAMLDGLRPNLVWLRGAVLQAMRQGAERGAIHAANLIPPMLQQSGAQVQLAYLVMRENTINRLFDQHSGYWQNGQQGLDSLTAADYGVALADYLGVTDTRLAETVEHLVADGRHELAAALVRWGETRFPDSAPLAAAKRQVNLKLMERFQEFNPFKFILYAGQAGQAVPQLALPSKRAEQVAARPQP